MTHLPFCARLFDGDDSLEEKKTEQRRWPTWRAAARGLSISGLCVYLSVVGSPSPCRCSTLADRVAGGSVSAPLCSRDLVEPSWESRFVVFFYFLFFVLSLLPWTRWCVCTELKRTESESLTTWQTVLLQLLQCARLTKTLFSYLSWMSDLHKEAFGGYSCKNIFLKNLHVVRIRG